MIGAWSSMVGGVTAGAWRVVGAAVLHVLREVCVVLVDVFLMNGRCRKGVREVGHQAVAAQRDLEHTALIRRPESVWEERDVAGLALRRRELR